ncbi:MAG: tyrosine-type recombinase/integrase [Fibrobacterales bacterium]
MQIYLEKLQKHLLTQNKSNAAIEYHTYVITQFLRWTESFPEVTPHLVLNYILENEVKPDRDAKYVRAIVGNFYKEIYRYMPPPQRSVNKETIEQLAKQLRYLNYSEATIRNYVSVLKDLDRFIEVPFDQLTNQMLKNYFIFLSEVKKQMGSTINIAISAVRSLYKIELKKSFSFILEQRPRQSKHLPIVLAHDEITQILKAITNSKHHTCISLMYSTGMRVSEVSNLKVADLDIPQRTIHLKEAKGNKDRIVIIPESLIESIKSEMRYSEPSTHLFRSERGGGLSTRTISAIVKRAATKAKITKNVSPHTFRHSFATHLLEKGVDIRYIQKLMGHSNIQTTTRYTKVAQDALHKLPSLL